MLTASLSHAPKSKRLYYERLRVDTVPLADFKMVPRFRRRKIGDPQKESFLSRGSDAHVNCDSSSIKPLGDIDFGRTRERARDDMRPFFSF